MRLKSLHPAIRALSITYEGAKEAVMAVAERVARRVQSAKLQLQAVDAETRLRQAYEGLGLYLYQTRIAKASSPAMTMDGTLPLLETIRSEQRTIQTIRDRLASQYDVLTLPLIRLQEDLQQGGGSVERVTIAPGTPPDGKPLKDLVLPDSVRIVMIRRGESLLFPTEGLLLRAGDQITLIGDRSAVPGALQSLRA